MLEIRPLTAADLGAAVGLSTQAGWNQVAADWKRLLDLCPDGCFAGTVDGEVVATTTVLTYDDGVSWIGMVLVDEAHRNRGYGTQIFERGLEHAREHGGETVGLDATAQGARIYRKYGFERVASVTRWASTIDPPDDVEAEQDRIERVDGDDLADVCAFDRAQVGVDRESLLRALLTESDTVCVCSRSESGVDGYAVARPGRLRWQIGPVVATEADTIAPLLRRAVAAAGIRDVIVDAPDRPAIQKQLRDVGLQPVRDLERMTSPEAQPALLGESVAGFVDFAFG